MSTQNTGDKYILIGATSGLGFDFLSQLPHDTDVMVVGRISEDQFYLKQQNQSHQNLQTQVNEKAICTKNRIKYFQTDLSKLDQLNLLTDKIQNFIEIKNSADNFEKPMKIRLFYFAGGGPYGDFAKKKFSDHMWSMNVSFLAFAEILHFVLNNFKDLSKIQIIAIGSAIAESKPDGQAASYSAAKHALKGLISSVQLENISADIRLFSPSYMQTKMLPPNSWVYQLTGLVDSPLKVASILGEWSKNPLERGRNMVLALDQSDSISSLIK